MGVPTADQHGHLEALEPKKPTPDMAAPLQPIGVSTSGNIHTPILGTIKAAPEPMSVEQHIRHYILVPLVHEILMKRQRESGSLVIGDESKIYGNAIAAINQLRRADMEYVIGELSGYRNRSYKAQLKRMNERLSQ